MKKTVIEIKKDVQIAEGVILSKGDMLIEKSNGRWMLIEAEGDDDGADDDETKDEDEDGDADDGAGDDAGDTDDKKDEKKKKK